MCQACNPIEHFQTRGITFASVHDSYWTHACNIDQMSSIIRDTFIALHSSDVLRKLEAEFKARYADYKVPLASLKVGSLIKKLKAAGVRIVASPEQAAAIQSADTASFAPLLDVSDTEESSITFAPSLAPSQSTPDVDVADLPKKARTHKRRSLSAETAVAQDDESVETEAEAEPDEEDIYADSRLTDKFISLTALIPPLPKKGDFKVESIKKSQYFFS